MTTMAEKFSANDTTLTIIAGRSLRAVSEPELAEAIEEAYSVWQMIGALEARLRQAKALIVRRAEELAGGGSTVTLECGDVRCTVTMRCEAQVPEENVAALRKLLGRRFRDLVKRSVRHTATSRLVSEADQDALSLLRLKRLSPQFKWSAR